MRKIFTLLLATFFSCGFLHALNVTYEGLKYSYTPGATMQGATVVSNTDATGNITIPKEIKVNSIRYAVKSIEEKAFMGSAITSVTIENGVTSIKDSAFYGCANLKSIIVPASVKTLGTNSLNAKNRIDIAINSSYLTNGEMLASALPGRIYGTLTLNADTVNVKLKNNGFIERLVFGPQVKVVKEVRVSEINEMVFGKNIEDLSSLNFRHIEGELYFQSAVYKAMFQMENVSRALFGDKNAMEAISSELETIEFSEGVKIVGEKVFKSPGYMESKLGIQKVTFPTTLQEIGNQAFAYQKYLTSIEGLKDNVMIGEGAFEGTGLMYANVSGFLYTSSFSDCINLKTFIIADGVETVYDDAISGDSTLTHLEIPSSILFFGKQKKIENNLMYLKDLSDKSDIRPVNKECVIITNGEEKAEEYRGLGYANVFSIESTKYKKEDVNWDSELNTQDVMEVYEAIKKQ